VKLIKSRANNLIYNIKVTSNHNRFLKDTYHLNYESGKYRQDELVKLIRDTVIFFALTREELSQINADTLAKLQKRAWNRISNRAPGMKGDYGELLLYLILEVFYPAKKFVTKVRLRTSLGDEIKGYDCAHFSLENNQICLWLGEAKFHQDFSSAISSVIVSVNDHISDKKLKDELSVLEGNNNELTEDEREIIDNYLNSGISLNEMKFKIPILITYDCSLIKTYNDVCNEFIIELQDELDKKFKLIDEKPFTLKSNIELHFILMPLETVRTIKEELEKVEIAHK
jgi:hypothetical protein